MAWWILSEVIRKSALAEFDDAVVPAAEADKLIAFLTYKGEQVRDIGVVVSGEGVEIAGLDRWHV